MAACPSCAADLAGTPRFCPECGARLSAPQPARDVRKTVTVLFADLAGSTALGEQLDPESLRALLSRYFAELRSICERHGGTVEKFIGDAVMAVFGIPVVHEDDALRAVRAAAEIRDRVGSLSAELERSRAISLRVRVGVNTGEVVAGDERSGETLVTGDAVNTAARLEQAAAPNQVLIGRATLRLVRDAVTVEAVPAVSARGKAEPVPAFELVSVKAGAAGHERRLAAPLVGRERELDRLRAVWEDARTQRRPHLFTLLGAAGVGKSRLVREFLATIGPEGLVLSGTCLSYGDGITWWPLRGVIHAAAGIEEGDDAGSAHARLETLLAGERDGRTVVGHLAAAIGLAHDAAAGDEIPWATRRLLQVLGRRQPLVVVWDDLQWAEPAFLDLVEQVVDLVRDLPLVVLCMARPDLLDSRPGWGGGKLAASTVLLDPLSGTAANRLITNLPGGSSLPAGLRERIGEAAEGNPLYVEEMLAMLADEGYLVRTESGGWAAGREFDRVPVPPTIGALLAARLDRLPRDERAIAERAAVVGRIFERTAVVAMSPEAERSGVTTSLLGLVRKELLRPEHEPGLGGDDAYAFRHLLIRDAAYEVLPKADRAALHERFADWLESAAGDRLPEYEEIVGHHLGEAVRYREELGLDEAETDRLRSSMADRLANAGRRAFYRGDSRAAVQLYDRALQAASLRHPALRRDMAFYGIALVNAERADDAERLFADAQRTADEVGDVTLGLRARLLEIDQTIFDAPNTNERDRLILPVVRELEAANDDWGAARGWGIVADLHTLAGRAAEAERTAVRAVELAKRSGDPRETARQLHALIVALTNGPTPTGRAVPTGEVVVREAAVSRPFEALCRATFATLLAMSGAAGRAREMVRSAEEIATDVADPGIAGIVATFEAWTEMILGRPGEAAAALRRWLAVAGVTHGARFERAVQGALADLLVRLGEVDEARQLVIGAAAGPLPSVIDDVVLRRARARLATQERAFETAAALIDEARSLISRTDFLSDRADLELLAAELAAEAGDVVVARRSAAEAVRLYSLKEHAPGEAAARRLLDELPGRS